MEFRHNKPQSRRWAHVIHCIDSLRQEVICHADDTPRFSDTSKIPESGVGQVRQCRNWDQLAEWAKRYDACYRYISGSASRAALPQVQKFLYCLEGSPYRREVEKVFGPIYENGVYDEMMRVVDGHEAHS